MTPIRTSIGALAIAATALTALPTTAQAGGRHGDSAGSRAYVCGPNVLCSNPPHIQRRGWHAKRYKHGKKVYRQRDNGDAAALILGLTGLAIIGGAIASQNSTLPHTADPNHRRGHDHYRPAPNAPGVITYESSLEPWSPGWYRWCEANYRSFDPERGTYRGYDGRDHFCVPK